MHFRIRPLPPAIAALALAASAATAQPTTQDQMMYFRAFVQDAPDCTATVEDGAVSYPGIASPAATCPDTFAWGSLLTSIADGFWTYARDETIWQDSPVQLCAQAGDTGCCDASVLDQDKPIEGAPPAGCPYAPGDWTEAPELSITPTNRHAPPFVNTLDPGRELRDQEAEQVYRNAAMLRYIFENNLYTKEGLGARFTAVNDALSSNVPYHPTDLTVRYPEDAVMIKVDWVIQSVMEEAGLITSTGPDGETLDPPQNPDYPYVTVQMLDATSGEPALYYLVAMTNSSKVLPEWHWYAIEHVANRGRCDFIGCNDSFGYTASGLEVDGRTIGTNYIPPFPLMEAEDATDITPSGYGQVYTPEETGEQMTDALAALYDGLGIGTAETDADPTALDPADPAWRNYRLKGTQTSFTTHDGVETIMGASVTEGGFVNSASCMTCHSQATVDGTGNVAIEGFGSINRLNIFGYQQSSSGAPEEAWFYNPGAAVYEALPMDFVWGIANASCSSPEESGDDCTSYDGIVLSFPSE